MKPTPLIMATVLICIATASLASAPQDCWKHHRAALPADPDLIAYYDFSGAEGEVLKNLSAHGDALDGRIHHGEWSEGRFDGKGSLFFDGASTYVEIPDHGALVPDTMHDGFTILVWLKSISSQQAGIVDKSSEGSGIRAPYALWHNPDMAVFGGDGSESSSTASGVTGWDALDAAEAADWIQLAMVVGEGKVSLYRNGRLISDSPLPPQPAANNGQPLLIGCMNPQADDGRFFFHGFMDEVIILGRAMSRHEIRADWLACKEGAEPSLALYSPAGGEQWAAGSMHRILWTPSDESRPVTIEYSTDGGKRWRTIVENLPNEPIPGMVYHMREHSQFLWEIPDTVSDAVRLRVTQAGDPVLVDETRADFSIIPSQEVTNYEWVQVADGAPFAARDGAAGLVHDGKMWLIAGWNPRDKEFFPRVCNNEVWASADGKTWDLIRANTFLDDTFDSNADWEGRHTMGSAVHDGYLWVIGGDFNQGHAQDDVWRSRDGRHWERTAAEVPWGPRGLHHAVSHDGKLWVMGGQSRTELGPDVEEVFYNDVWSSADGVEWSLVTAEAPWEARGMHEGSVVFNDHMWLIGGGTYTTRWKRARLYFLDVWSSADGKDWQRHVEFAPWPPRSYHNTAVFDDRIWVLAGGNSQHLGGDMNDVWYSADGVNWYELPGTPWIRRHAATVFVHDNALWMVAGAPAQDERSVWKLEKR